MSVTRGTTYVYRVVAVNAFGSADASSPAWATSGRASPSVAAGWDHTCAVTTGGRLLCWGDNASGQLGDGTTIDRSTPTPVSGPADPIVAVSGGMAHTCAVTASGGAWCWGENANGQLGDGTTTSRSLPVAVSGLESVVAIAAGLEHTCAVTAPGAARCWGRNDSGQLGDGTTLTRVVPVAVTGLGIGVMGIAGGRGHTCAVTVGGELRCWGDNRDGAVGDGTTVTRLEPVAVAGFESGCRLSPSAASRNPSAYPRQWMRWPTQHGAAT